MIDRILLAPYWLILSLRHMMYDRGWKKQARSRIPTVCVGNVTVGGTGKTPHTEMLIRLITTAFKDKSLSPSGNVYPEGGSFVAPSGNEYPKSEDSPSGNAYPVGDGQVRIAVLSRGYGRKSKGFRLVETDGTAEEFGDEPLQIKRKFPHITVAVCRDRVEGCRILAEGAPIRTSSGETDKAPVPDLIILDDALQYRRLHPDLSICLVDWNRPVYKDSLLPLGRLRDLPSRVKKADLVIATKCPAYLSPEEKQHFLKKQKCGTALYTTVRYDNLEPVFEDGDLRYTHSPRLILFTGIANDRQLYKHLTDSYTILEHFQWPDHHKFSKSDIRTIEKAAEKSPTAVVVTTEKDSQRLRPEMFSESLRKKLFKAPIKAEFVEPEDAATLLGLIPLSRKESRSEPEQTPRG